MSNLKYRCRIDIKAKWFGQVVRLYEATLYQKVEIFDIFWAAFPPLAPIEVKFCAGKRTQVPVGPAKFDLNRCNESPLRGEKPDFWPVSKFNTSSLTLRGIPPVTTADPVLQYGLLIE